MGENTIANQRWLPINLNDLPLDVRKEITKEIPNTLLIVDYLQQEFGRQIGVDEVVVQAHISDFRNWLWYQFENDSTALFVRKFPRLQHLIFLDYATKQAALSQRTCQICNPKNEIQGAFPIFHLPLRIPGRSRQAISAKEFQTYQIAIKARLGHITDTAKFDHYCIGLTFILRPNRRDRDLDNMTKTIIDAIARAVGFDDRRVQHIDAVKLVIPDAEESVTVRISPSFLNSDNDVVLKEYQLGWAGQEPLLGS